MNILPPSAGQLKERQPYMAASCFQDLIRVSPAGMMVPNDGPNVVHIAVNRYFWALHGRARCHLLSMTGGGKAMVG